MNLPHDIAGFVESVYEDCDGEVDETTVPFDVPDTWQSKIDEAERELTKRRADAASNAKTWLLGKPQSRSPKDMVGWLRESLTMTDENVGRATVRDSQESIEVIAVQECSGGLCIFPWVDNVDGSSPTSRSLGDGEMIPDDDAARLAATCTVNLPPALSGPWNAEAIVKALEMSCPIPGWQESRWLKGQLVLVFNEAGEATIDTGIAVYRLRYAQGTGLELIDTKKGEQE